MEQLYPWAKLLHTLGFAFWVGGLAAVARMLSGTDAAEHQREQTVRARKSVAMVADIACTLTLVAGILLIIATRHMGDAWPMKQGWLHAKLLAVFGVLGLHGVLRVKIKRLAGGNGTAPAWAFPAVLALAFAIVFLAVKRPF